MLLVYLSFAGCRSTRRQGLFRQGLLLLRPCWYPEMDPGDCGRNAVFRHDPVPQLSLNPDLGYQFRVYVLLLAAGRIYVGICSARRVRQRLLRHFEGKGAAFTKAWPPIVRGVVCLWPAFDLACEGYMYAVMAGVATSSILVGGFLQGSARPTPLQSWFAVQTRRAVQNLCFRCGGSGHKSETCTRAASVLTFRCSQCGVEHDIRGQGYSELKETAEKACQSHGEQAVVEVVESPDPAPAKCPPRKRSTNPNSGFLVLHGGVELSLLSWYLGKEATRPQRERALRALDGHSAWKIEGGAPRSLVTAGYAKSSSPPAFVPFGSVTLVCVASPTSLNHLLIPLTILEATFPRTGV
jgi:hypothetical protein